MPTDASPSPGRRSEARDRLLATATALFYVEGIGSVGVDRLVTESRTTLATFYRHFPGKQDLVVAYLRGVHDQIAERADAVAGSHDGRRLVQAIGAEVVADLTRTGFRGCAFINAASEFEDPDSPVRRAVADHRAWYHAHVRDAFAGAGHRRAADAARHFVMLRDGAVTAGYLDDPTAAARTFKRGVEGLLRSIELEPRD